MRDHADEGRGQQHQQPRQRHDHVASDAPPHEALRHEVVRVEPSGGER